MDDKPKEVYEAFEMTYKKNMNAVLEDNKLTRKQLESLRTEMENLRQQVINLQGQINGFNGRLALVQQKVAQGGTA